MGVSTASTRHGRPAAAAWVRMALIELDGAGHRLAQRSAGAAAEQRVDQQGRRRRGERGG